MTPPSADPPGAADATADPVVDEPGRVLDGRHRLERIIASGGMATVWEATDLDLGRRVAVKILHPHLSGHGAIRDRFRNEALTGARLAHPNIVAVLDSVLDGDVDAIVLELVRGTTLRDRIDRTGPIRPDIAASIGAQIAAALDHAHRTGTIHRDVKPANILLAADGRALLADFGIASGVDIVDPIERSSFVGTAKYLAPEQVAGGIVDGRADIYALGIVLHEALTGDVPFHGADDLAVARARLERRPRPIRELRPTVPGELEHIVSSCLVLAVDDRFPDAGALRRALLEANDARPSPH